MLRLCVDAIFVSNVASPARTLTLTLSLTRAHTRTRRLPCLCVCAAAAALKHTHIRTQEGNSCLHIAAAQGSKEILRILLHAGAKVSAKNKVDR